MSKEPQKLIRAKQAAHRYSVGKSTIWLFARQGRITPIKVSKGVTAFSVEELDKFFGIA